MRHWLRVFDYWTSLQASFGGSPRRNWQAAKEVVRIIDA
jgi:hypothetical protein